MILSDPKGSEPDLIDVHHHLIPPGYREALEAAGLETSHVPPWSPELSLRKMDGMGVRKAVLSLSSPGVWLGDGSDAPALARSVNEYASWVVRAHPGRFGALASLPLPDVEGALEELDYALGTLGMEGVILLSNVEGTYVGDPEWDPIMAELHRRKAVVLLHPNHVPAGHEYEPLYPEAEYPIDLTRAWARMVYRDTLVKYDRIRWILACAGGAVPFMAERLGKAHYAKDGGLRWGRILKDLALKRHGGLKLAEDVLYDTVGAENPVTYAALRQLAGSDGIRFGSDLPWGSEAAAAASLRLLHQEEGSWAC